MTNISKLMKTGKMLDYTLLFGKITFLLLFGKKLSSHLENSL